MQITGRISLCEVREWNRKQWDENGNEQSVPEKMADYLIDYPSSIVNGMGEPLHRSLHFKVFTKAKLNELNIQEGMYGTLTFETFSRKSQRDPRFWDESVYALGWEQDKTKGSLETIVNKPVQTPKEEPKAFEPPF